MSQTTHEANDHGRQSQVLWRESAHHFGTTSYLAESFDEPGGEGAFGMHHSFLYFFPFRFAFPNFRTRISRPLAYSVRISSKASTTAGLYKDMIRNKSITFTPRRAVLQYDSIRVNEELRYFRSSCSKCKSNCKSVVGTGFQEIYRAEINWLQITSQGIHEFGY